jgi:hypothetical protein
VLLVVVAVRVVQTVQPRELAVRAVCGAVSQILVVAELLNLPLLLQVV